MNKTACNIRIYKQDADSEFDILPLSLAVVEDLPNLSEDYDDEYEDPRSVVIYLSWNSSLEKGRYKEFEEWVAESLSADAARKTAGKKRKKPQHCSAVLTHGQETRYLNYVYLEEIHYTSLDYIDLGLVEVKAILDYRSMTHVPIQVTGVRT